MSKKKDSLFVDKNEEKVVTSIVSNSKDAVDINEPTKEEIFKARMPFYILLSILILIAISLLITVIVII